MASGGKQLILNTQERVVSTDLNRAQTFAQAMTMELLRGLVDTYQGNDELDAGGNAVEYSTLEAPVRAEILAGLMVVPGVAGTGLAVTAGTAVFLAPDGSGEDSPLKYVRDAGVVLGGLNIAANAAGAIRIDVIECQWGMQVIESDNRDVLNLATGAFAPSAVSKVNAGVLTYRVRSGSAGGGYPGSVAGWLPLAVASVPNGSTTNDTVTFWDVRPLVSDRQFAPFSIDDTVPAAGPRTVGLTDLTNVTVFTGRTTAYANGRRLGGRMRRGTPGVDAESVDMFNQDNIEGGFTPITVNNGVPFVYGYLLTPFGLPRWARYTDASTGVRRPRSPRGIYVTSNKPPQHLSGLPNAAITLPVSTGLNGVTDQGACIFAMTSSAKFSIQDQWQQNYNAFFTAATAMGAQVSQSYQFALSSNVHYPPNARAIYVGIRFTLPIPASRTYRGYVYLYANRAFVASGVDPAAFDVKLNDGCENLLVYTNSNAGTVTVDLVLPSTRIPILPNYGQKVGRSMALLAFVSGGWVDASGATGPIVTGVNAVAAVVGWDY